MTQNERQEKAEDMKHMNQMITAVVTGYFKSTNKKRGKKKTLGGGVKRSRKEALSSSSISSDEESDSLGLVEEVEARVVKSAPKSGGDDDSCPHCLFQHSAD